MYLGLLYYGGKKKENHSTQTSGRHRRYPIEKLDRLLGNTYMKYGNKTMNCLIYARVSTKKQVIQIDKQTG